MERQANLISASCLRIGAVERRPARSRTRGVTTLVTKRTLCLVLALLMMAQAGCTNASAWLRYGFALDLFAAPIAFLTGLFAA